MAVYVDVTLCKSCKLCIANCPKNVFVVTHKVNRKGYNYVEAANAADCIGCGLCEKICPDFAIHVEKNNREE